MTITTEPAPSTLPLTRPVRLRRLFHVSAIGKCAKNHVIAPSDTCPDVQHVRNIAAVMCQEVQKSVWALSSQRQDESLCVLFCPETGQEMQKWIWLRSGGGRGAMDEHYAIPVIVQINIPSG